MTVSKLPEGVSTASTVTDTQPNRKVAQQRKKVSAASATVATAPVAPFVPVPTLPTGKRPVTREDLIRAASAPLIEAGKHPIDTLAENGLFNLLDQIEAVFQQLRRAQDAATRSIVQTPGERDALIDTAPEDITADRFHDLLHSHAFAGMPRAGKAARYESGAGDWLAGLLFGQKSVKRYLRARSPGATDATAKEKGEDDVRADTEEALRIAKVYFLARQYGAGRMLLSAAARIVQSHTIAQRFAADGEDDSEDSDVKQADKPAARASKPERRTAPAAFAAFEWPYDEVLTEPEGHALRAFRAWTKAQSDPLMRKELDIRELIGDYLYDYRDGKGNRDTFREHWGLTDAEHAAMQTVADLWQRLAVEESEADARREAGEATAADTAA